MLPIGETGKYINGIAFKPTDWSDEGLPIVRIQNLTDRTKPMNRTMRLVDPAYVVRPGDLLVSWSATLDAFIWDREPALLNQHIFKVVPNTELVSKKYLFFALRQAIVEMGRTGHLHGSTMKHINRGPFLAHCIRVPPLWAQAEIVAELEEQFSRLDEAVAILRRVKANLKRQRSSVLQRVTSGGLAAEGGAAPPSDEWRWLTIDELALPAPRSIQSGPFGSNLRHAEFQATGKLVIGIDNVRDGEFSLGSNHRISEAKFDELAKYAARPGDVLITVMATIGRVCVVPHDIEPAIITKHVYRITVNRDLAIPDYVAIALRGSREVRAQLMDSVQGQTRPGLNGGLIKKIRVPVPALACQRSIVAEVDRRLSIVREVEAEVDANLKRAQALRQAVLARAFAS
jgi:type I restriction enzyme S subunit